MEYVRVAVEPPSNTERGVCCAALMYVVGCEPAAIDVSLTRVAPAEALVEVDGVAHYGVRGCIYDVDEDALSNPLPFAIHVDALASSNSNGTAALTLAFDEDRQSYQSHLGTLRLFADHDFEGLTDEVVGPDQVDACTDWQSVEFSWEEVDGDDPLRVSWQVRVEPEERDDYDLGIDFTEL